MKFSVRSERSDVNAGELTDTALEGIGNGGGHASMAGGRISQAMVEELGEYRNNVITERFLKALGLKF